MSLRSRIAAFVAVAVAVSVAAVAFGGYRSARAEALAEIDRFLLGRAGLVGLVESFEPGGPGRGGPRVGPGTIVGEDVVAQLITVDGFILVLGEGPVQLPVDDEDLELAARGGESLRTVEVAGTEYRMLTRRAGPGIAVQVARDLSEADAILAGIRNRLVLVGLLAAGLAALLGWLLAGRALRPVTELTAAAEDVATTGSLDSAIPVERGDEIGRLAEAFNAMLERLEDARSSQQRLVADASHELRTPLTSLRTNIELLARGDVPEGDASAMLEDLKSEIFELGAMVSELVDLATIGREDEQAAEVDLRELTAHAVDRARRRSSGIEIRTDLETVRREVKAAAVDRAIANILDNAIKWTPRGGTIEVALDDEGLRVRDSGAGFEADDLPRVFERFYRASSARSHPGSGLGLSIVAAVAADHGWTPFARNAAGGGGEVGIEFGR